MLLRSSPFRFETARLPCLIVVSGCASDKPAESSAAAPVLTTSAQCIAYAEYDHLRPRKIVLYALQLNTSNDLIFTTMGTPTKVAGALMLPEVTFQFR